MIKGKIPTILWRKTDDTKLYGICPYCGKDKLIYHTDNVIDRYGPDTYSTIKYCQNCKMRIEEDNQVAKKENQRSVEKLS